MYSAIEYISTNSLDRYELIWIVPLLIVVSLPLLVAFLVVLVMLFIFSLAMAEFVHNQLLFHFGVKGEATISETETYLDDDGDLCHRCVYTYVDLDGVIRRHSDKECVHWPDKDKWSALTSTREEGKCYPVYFFSLFSKIHLCLIPTWSGQKGQIAPINT